MKKRVARDVLIVLLIFFGVTLWQTRDLVSSGAPAPAVEGPRLDGTSYSLTQSRGKAVMLYFFAPWCGVCKVSASNASWLRKLLPEDRFEVVAVALDYEGDADVQAFVKEAGIESLPVVKGSDAIRDAYKIGAYPTYYVVDPEGRVGGASVGYSTLLGMLLRSRFLLF